MVQPADGLDDIRSHNSHRGPSCKTGPVIESLDGPQRDKLERALRDPTIERKAVWRWLRAQGIEVSWYSFEHHAMGNCLCAR